AVFAGRELKVPVLFAKKGETSNLKSDLYQTPIESFTHHKTYNVTVSKEFLGKEDKVLIVDDFLANGKALEGLIDIVGQAGGEVIGCAIAIEKGFQGAGDRLRKQGVRIESLAIIDEMTDSSVTFRSQEEEKGVRP
ncbi:MAG: phosphoribosyltransferase family protein, partial [Candidatus Borkfalkiaceae bacterium]|nr:phosphoribosyltransferase family protein [Christensenellaceae bacterium]